MLASMDLCKLWTCIVIIHCLIALSWQAATVVEHPQNVTANEGDTILLRCKFNDAINKCVWFRNGTAVNIKYRYKYLNSTAKGTNTNDCSIEISMFGKTDATHWHCSCAADSDSTIQTCKSKYAYLSTNNFDFNNSEVTPELTSSVSPNNETASSFLTMTNILLLVVIGVFLASMLLVTIYFHRVKKALINGNSQHPVITTETPQSPPGPEFHEYTYITTPENASEEDPMGYLVPKDATVKGNDSESQPSHHIYQEIPEIIK